MLTENCRVDIDHNSLCDASQLQAKITNFRERVHWLRFVPAVPFWCRAHFRNSPLSHSLTHLLSLSFSLSLADCNPEPITCPSVNRFLIILCLPGTHSPHVLFPYFLCLVCVIKCKFRQLFNRCQDATPHRLATHACCHMWQPLAKASQKLCHLQAKTVSSH